MGWCERLLVDNSSETPNPAVRVDTRAPAPYWDGERINIPHPRHWRTGRQGRPDLLRSPMKRCSHARFSRCKSYGARVARCLEKRAVEITHSESLELIAKAFGYDNWNILSAKIEVAEQRGGATPMLSPTSAPDSASNEIRPTLALPPDITIDIQQPSPDVPSNMLLSLENGWILGRRA